MESRTKPKIRSLQRVVANLTSMLTSAIATRAASLVMYILVARHLGTHAFGQLSLAMSLFMLFHRFAVLGVKELVIREIAKDRKKTNLFLVNATVTIIASSTLCFFLLVLFVWLTNYSQDTASIIALLFLGLLPYSLSKIYEGIFQAWERMKFIAYTTVPIGFIQVAATFYLLTSNHDLRSIVVLMVASYTAIMLLQLGLIFRFISTPRLTININFSLAMVRASAPFFGIQGLIALQRNLNVLLLSLLVDETAVGLYSAATQLLSPLRLVFENTTQSIFPVMVRKFKAGITNLTSVTTRLIEFLLAIGLPIVVSLFLLAEPILLLLYENPDFSNSATILRIIVWLPLQQTLTSVLGRVLWASHREVMALRISAINAVARLLTSFILISQFGIIGAAIASVFIATINLIQHYVPNSNLLPGTSLLHLIWKPIVSVCCMVGVLLLSRDLHVLLGLIFASGLYFMVLLGLFVLSAGSWHGFIARFKLTSETD